MTVAEPSQDHLLWKDVGDVTSDGRFWKPCRRELRHTVPGGSIVRRRCRCDTLSAYKQLHKAPDPSDKMAAGNANRCVFPAGLLLLLVICENGNSTNAADAGPFKGIVGATPEILDVLNAMTKKIGVLESQMSVLKRGGPKRRDPPPHAVDVHPVDSGLSHLMRKAASGVYPLKGPIRAKLLRHTDIGDSYSTVIQAAMVSRKKTTETKFDHTTDVKELLSDGKLDMGTVRGLNQADLVMKNQILVG